MTDEAVYRAGMYSTWPMYPDQTTVSQYKEGTLDIDITDAARKRLFWEGVVTDSVTQGTLDNLQPALDAAVAATLAQYAATGPAKAE